MKTIWKFELDVADEQTVAIPWGAEILHVGVQRGVPCLWARVDSLSHQEVRTFRTFGTGHPVNEDPMKFIGTYMLQDEALVFHVFEVCE